MNRIKISVLIPTRDRPELFKACLDSLVGQGRDFEVIVSDNFTTSSVEHICNDFKGEAIIKYCRPPADLEMADNWEYAYQQSSGELIVTLIDKTVLLPGALAKLAEAAGESDAEIFSWSSDYYVPKDGVGIKGDGFCSPQYKKRSFSEIPTEICIKDRVSFKSSIGAEGVNYFYAKACFGAFRRTLTEKIVQETGRLFHTLSPDFTTTIFALMFSSKIYDFGRPYVLSILSSVSNGMQFSGHAAYAKELCSQVSDVAYGMAPIVGLYSSTHNLIAADYIASYKRVGRELNFDHQAIYNFACHVMADLAYTAFSRRSDRRDQFCRFKSFAKKHAVFEDGVRSDFLACYPWKEKIKDLCSRVLFGSFDELDCSKVMAMREAANRESLLIYEATYKSFSSPLEAASYLGAHYELGG